MARALTHKKTAIMVNRPSPSYICERPPFRAAASTRRNLPHRLVFVAAQRLWAALGLRSSGFAVPGTYFCTHNTPSINQMSVLGFRGSVEPHMHGISLGIVRIERKGGEAVKLSNR